MERDNYLCMCVEMREPSIFLGGRGQLERARVRTHARLTYTYAQVEKGAACYLRGKIRTTSAEYNFLLRRGFSNGLCGSKGLGSLSWMK